MKHPKKQLLEKWGGQALILVLQVKIANIHPT